MQVVKVEEAKTPSTRDLPARLDLTIHKKDQTPDAIYLHGLQQILTDFPGFRPIFTDGYKSEDGLLQSWTVVFY
nr:hypothetical protein BaRGS_005447 [Batillaria attramentaria]